MALPEIVVVLGSRLAGALFFSSVSLRKRLAMAKG